MPSSFSRPVEGYRAAGGEDGGLRCDEGDLPAGHAADGNAVHMGLRVHGWYAGWGG
jgi:hypothetical protein